MLEIFPYGKSAWYPHMKPRDIEIWNRFIEAYPDAYTECQYDVHVGDGPSFDTSIDGIEESNQHMLYQLKIDVVGFKNGARDIIEVKPDAGASAIGQLLGYRALYLRDVKTLDPVNTVLVTNVERPNMRYLCNQHGVSLIVV